ncbi:MAG: lysophospholipid acyltransferase family protein [Anaerolineales bacterium]|nr:lysophospholipid acyltransferase family protein [Anaerolineales bacterium]MCB9146106.1 lysophospholipid acyltransferase family protein [Anaerolineales bacterium]
MKKTIFNTPIISPFVRLLSNTAMRLSGWRVEGKLPDFPKYLIIGAPHTSNWDFLLFVAVIFKLKANVRYMGKAELFRGPFAWFFYWCGGIPVDRKKSTGLVEQMVDAYTRSERFVLTIAPEGTRYQVKEWKRGFYHIAKAAGVPIVMAKVDGKGKVMRVGQVYHLTDDIETDMREIQGAFSGLSGIQPKAKKYITLQG